MEKNGKKWVEKWDEEFEEEWDEKSEEKLPEKQKVRSEEQCDKRNNQNGIRRKKKWKNEEKTKFIDWCGSHFLDYLQKKNIFRFT